MQHIIQIEEALLQVFPQNFNHEKEFGDKLLYLQDNDVPNNPTVMVPEHWEEYYERSKRFGDRGSPLHLFVSDHC